MGKVSTELPRYTGKRLDQPVLPKDDPSNFYICNHCGQSVYMGDLGQVMYHENNDHDPIIQDA